jgi:hypothetical protein
MENKNVVAVVIVLILIVVGMFMFAYLKRTEINTKGDTPVATSTKTESPYKDIVRIDAKHFFIDPTHTVVGEIQMPTPCDLLNWSTRTLETSPKTVLIDFTVINHSESCTQVVTAQRFKVAFDAPKDVTIRATLEGRELPINLIQPLPGETPENFEMFIKG